MGKFMDLGTLVLLVLIAAGVITIIYRTYKLKKNDGVIDENERGELLETVRSMVFNLVKEALDIQKKQNEGDVFVRTYIVDKLTILISESNILTQEEKELIITYMLEEAVDSVLKLLGYDVVEIKKVTAQARYYKVIESVKDK